MIVLQKESIEPRLDGIEKELVLLRQFAKEPFDRFQSDIILDRTQLHLRFALEGIFHIGSHILSRTPGGRFTEYKEIARKLGETGIVDKTFAEHTLTKMAGYRNRLTHFYAEITPQELYEILNTHLDDITTFVQAIKTLLKSPKKFGFSTES
ncbi:MAG: HepT-like ribonuclease domain-containing protein [Patescibacteria group bacterium]